MKLNSCKFWTHRTDYNDCIRKTNKPLSNPIDSTIATSGPRFCQKPLFKRRKRRSTTGDTLIKYSLDKVFVQDEKLKYDLLVKKLKDNFTANFVKMDLIKSYPNLFELLW